MPLVQISPVCMRPGATCVMLYCGVLDSALVDWAMKIDQSAFTGPPGAMPTLVVPSRQSCTLVVDPHCPLGSPVTSAPEVGSYAESQMMSTLPGLVTHMSGKTWVPLPSASASITRGVVQVAPWSLEVVR